MMHFFPTPYPDEILYSVLARYSVRCGITSYQTIMESIFGKCSSRAVMEMPFNLNSLVSNLPVNCPYTADDLIYNHTLYPFFTAFLPKERAEEVKQLMLSEGGSKIYGKNTFFIRFSYYKRLWYVRGHSLYETFFFSNSQEIFCILGYSRSFHIQYGNYIFYRYYTISSNMQKHNIPPPGNSKCKFQNFILKLNRFIFSK